MVGSALETDGRRTQRLKEKLEKREDGGSSRNETLLLTFFFFINTSSAHSTFTTSIQMI